jgi:hypothetical protein
MEALRTMQTTEISPPLSAPIVHGQARVAETLPGMVVGDGAFAGPRVHGVRGSLFIGFSYVMAAGSACVALMWSISAATGGLLPATLWKEALTAAVWAVLQWRLVGEVRRFSRWGWLGAMAELSVASATKLVWISTAPGQAWLMLPFLGINLAMAHYFWMRRAQFDVSLGG